HHRYLHPFPTRRSSDLEAVPAPASAPHPRRASQIHIPETLTINSCVTGYLRGLRFLPAAGDLPLPPLRAASLAASAASFSLALRSEEHTSELQSRENIV